MINSGKIVLRDELAPAFAETGDLAFRDGRRVSAAEIWRFMKEDAPVRFPLAFSTDPHVAAQPRLSQDQELFSAIKRTYLQMTMLDFVARERQNGKRVALTHHFQSTELYFAAGVFPLSSIFANMISKSLNPGKAQAFLEGGQKWVSVEGCDGLVALNWAIRQSAVPVDYLSPNLCTFCSDIPYVLERHRTGAHRYPLRTIHFPAGAKDKEWAVDYLAEDLRRLAGDLGGLSGHPVTEEALQDEIKLQNKRRRLVKKYFETWWKAKVPPTTGLDNAALSGFAVDYPDPVAIEGLLKETNREVGDRVRNGELAAGLADEPVRIYAGVGGVISYLVDKSGGVLVGDDMGDPVVVKEKGDPFENLAKAQIDFRYEWPSEERAYWIAERVKRSRADGAIFTYYWGCNNASAIARLTADIVKEETGVPTVVIETNDMYRSDALGQVHTRIEAFVEILR